MAIARLSSAARLDIGLAELGWSKAELARRLGVHRNSVGAWGRSGEAPGYAMAYLSLALEIKRLAAILDKGCGS